MNYQDYLENIYYDPQHPGSLGGQTTRPSDKKENTCWEKPRSENGWETQETFGLHRQINRKFRRRKVIAPFIDYQWDADTAVMKSFVKDNDGYAYFVVAIDVFPRFAHTFPLRSTRGKEMSFALQTLFRRGKKNPPN
jgi:hypothetical protein